MKYKFDFLLLEFKDIYYILNKIWEEENLIVVNSTLIKFIKEIIIKAHLRNKIFYNTENTIEKNIEILYHRKIISYDFMRYIINYLEELYYSKELLNEESRNNKYCDKEEISFLKDLKSQEFIYKFCVWLVINCGEEDYSLFIDDLSVIERDIFNKFINDKSKEESGEITPEGIYNEEDFNEDFLEKEEVSAEENLLSGELYYSGKIVEKNYYKAKEYFEKSALEGNDQAESYLGLFFEKGYGGEKDINKALYWYKKAALKGNLFSQYSLGYIYYEGKDVEKNLYYAFKWYKEAAEKGFAPAQYALSYLYKNGEGCEANEFKAYYWLEESADNDYEDAYYILGQSYLEGINIETNYKKAFFYLSKGADIEDKNCLEGLGDMYYWGLHVKEDKEKAFSLYEKSLNKGNKSLYCKLGILYESDNIEKALEYYKKGHKKRDINSTRRLGIMYLYGQWVELDKEKGIQYIREGVERKDTESLYIMGQILLYIDRDKGIEYLKEAYRKGSTDAALVLAREGIDDYLNNKNIKGIDILGYVNLALDKKKPMAIYYYGLLYYHGIYFDKSYEKAFVYFFSAADKRCPEAMLMLGNWNKNGIFLSRDIDKAIEWYELAICGDNIDAFLELCEIYEKGIGVKKDSKKAFEIALTLRKIDRVEGDFKLAYYYYKGIGTKVSLEKANEYINELLILDEAKGYNLLGQLGEEGLRDGEDPIEYYLKSISLGNLQGYSNLEYYLYRKGRDISEYISEIPLGIYENGKSVYVMGMIILNDGIKNDDEDCIEVGIETLEETIEKGFYEGINDLIEFYKGDRSRKGRSKLYKYREMKVYYNV